MNTTFFYLQPRLLIILVLGFASGLPLALTASTLTAWLTEAGVSLGNIGLAAAIGLPYAFKYLWSPLLDGIRLPMLARMFGRRRSWLLVIQAALIAALMVMGSVHPDTQLLLLALIAGLVAFLSASQDIVIDALRIEMLSEDEQGAGAAMSVFGYRLGMIVSTAGALTLSSYVSWQETYFIMALTLLAGVAAVLLVREPTSLMPSSLSSRRRPGSGISASNEVEKGLEPGLRRDDNKKRDDGRVRDWLLAYVLQPFKEFATRPHWWVILLFIICFKLGEALLGFMTTPFLLQIGFTKTDIAAIVKLFGIAATIIGGFTGGWLVHRLGIYRTLWVGAIVQTATNLLYVWLAQVRADREILAIVISADNFSGGLGTTAFVAYLSALCNRQFTATQYALLNSLSSIGRTLLTTPSGWMAATFGWPMFFMSTIVIALPGMALLWWLRTGKQGIGGSGNRGRNHPEPPIP